MLKVHHIRTLHRLACLLIILCAQLPATIYFNAYAVNVPAYRVSFIGGIPRALNNTGQAVGWKLTDGRQQAWVYRDNIVEFLPVPEGWHAQANDINDNGVIIGSAGSDGNPGKSVIWQPSGNNYQMVIIDTPENDLSSSAIAINSFGDIVGTRTFWFEHLPGRSSLLTRGYLYTSSGQLSANLTDLGFSALPTDINDSAQIIGGSLRMTQNLVEDLTVPQVAAGETRFILSVNHAINNHAQVAGSSTLASSTTVRKASLFSDDTGWQTLSFGGSFDAAYGINDAGDVSLEVSFICPDGSAGAPAVFIQHTSQLYCIQQLLKDQDWQLFSAVFDNDINNSGQILLSGANPASAQNGAILLTPDRILETPSAAQDLTAIVIAAADAKQQKNRIHLSWMDTSNNETRFRLERRPANRAEWDTIATLNADTQAYNDNTTGSGISYQYRIIAAGLAGYSPLSNIIDVDSPPASVPQEPAVSAQQLTIEVPIIPDGTQ